jgi:hypothetical protein
MTSGTSMSKKICQKTYYQRNREYYLAYQKQYYATHKESEKEYSRDYYMIHKERYKLNAKHWHMRNGKSPTPTSEGLSSKYVFGQSFLFPVLSLSCVEEVYLLMTRMIEIKSLTNKQRELLVYLRDGYAFQQIAIMTDRTGPTLTKMLNGTQIYREDEIIRFYGGIIKKVYSAIINFSAHDPYLQLLITELIANKRSLYLGKNI